MESGERNRVERRLAAILAADIAGYSRLMGADEEETHARFKAHRRELINPKIHQHRGRIVKTTGDGMLVEFPSVVDAVRCAVEVQRAMVDRNAGLAEDRRIMYRVGINLGDIIVDGPDIYGDGVNVAARLEGLAEPGGLCISGMVHDHVRDKLAFQFVDHGEHTVKNIARPVHVFALHADALARLPALSEEPEVIRPPRHRYLWAGAAIAVVLVAGAVTAWWSQPVPSPTSAAAVNAQPETGVSQSTSAESAQDKLAALALPAPPAPPAPAADAVVWDVIKDGASPDPFEAFLRIYPDSQYAGAARAKLAAIVKPAPPPPEPAVPTPTMEGMIWAMIKDDASAGPFEEYLRTYPNGDHADAARAKLAALAKHARPPPEPAVPTPAMEAMIWEMIKDSASAGPFEEYLRTYPNGKHAGAARAKLAELSRAPPTKLADLSRAPPTPPVAPPPALRNTLVPGEPGQDQAGTASAPAPTIAQAPAHPLDRAEFHCPSAGTTVQFSTGQRYKFTQTNGMRCGYVDENGAARERYALFADGRGKSARSDLDRLWPLTIGKRIEFDLIDTSAGQDPWNASRAISKNYHESFEIVRQQSVTVPAGTFDTFVVEWREKQMSLGGGDVLVTFWYAPLTSYFVKSSVQIINENVLDPFFNSKYSGMNYEATTVTIPRALK